MSRLVPVETFKFISDPQGNSDRHSFQMVLPGPPRNESNSVEKLRARRTLFWPRPHTDSFPLVSIDFLCKTGEFKVWVLS